MTAYELPDINKLLFYDPEIEIFTEEFPSVVRRKLALSFIETLAYAYSSNVIIPPTLLEKRKVDVLFPLALIV
jgi:hypothetical protein